MTRIYRGVERRFTPWKNGGGETAEILCEPAGAGFDDFDWRISTAKVSRSGPFSRFPGVDRVLTVIEGGAMRLRFEDGRTTEARPGSGPHRFPGDLGCDAELLADELLDLNLMVRRPFQGAVHEAGEAIDTADLKAAYLFALDELHSHGLAAHDLMELAAVRKLIVPENALVLTIARGS
ncbi:HutD family protein [Pseudohoeflea suaedae]|uniref:HutD family protein n=1 Tax=Pseudohoeflea suaedae TaxID=877384 RepID=A0A4R5PQB4_9HYPH|nr:HutD family protein [Pseudohoeflea suaedae]TDH39324.1 HutD family protein [Pseudohoeflea suaedae]